MALSSDCKVKLTRCNIHKQIQMHLHTDSHRCTCAHEHAQTVTQTVSHSVLAQSLSQGYSPTGLCVCFTCVWLWGQGRWGRESSHCWICHVVTRDVWFSSQMTGLMTWWKWDSSLRSQCFTHSTICQLVIHKKAPFKCLISCISYAGCGYISASLIMMMCLTPGHLNLC